MDSIIAGYASVPNGDLMLCPSRGVAYQADMTHGRVEYGDAYWDKVSAYEDTEIARAVNAGRCAMLERHLPGVASVLDIGAGTGAFVRAARAAGYYAMGFDVIPKAVAALKSEQRYAYDPKRFDAVTMWDALEHMEVPAAVLSSMRVGAWLFVSVPIFHDLGDIRSSKHYRPGEHLYYFTAEGLIVWLGLYGFLCVETSRHETDAGRENIGAFAFRKVPTR